MRQFVTQLTRPKKRSYTSPVDKIQSFQSSLNEGGNTIGATGMKGFNHFVVSEAVTQAATNTEMAICYQYNF